MVSLPMKLWYADQGPTAISHQKSFDPPVW
jgi:hypothetical protein